MFMFDFMLSKYLDDECIIRNVCAVLSCQETEFHFFFVKVGSVFNRVIVGEFFQIDFRICSNRLTMVSRRAIDTSGGLGSLYDLKRDCVLERQTVHCENLIKEDVRLSQHALIDGDTNESKNILKKLDLDHALRLKILLKLTPRIGIAQLVDYPHAVDKYTRFLYMSYTFRQEQLPNDFEKENRRPKSSPRNVDATYFITAISFGVDIVVVLKLPSENNIVSQIDSILYNIIMAVEKHTDLPALNETDVSLLEKVSRMTIYSNMMELLGMTSLVTICDYINGLKRNSEQCSSIELYTKAY